jgi:methyl-accepting chemotaxis protein
LKAFNRLPLVQRFLALVAVFILGFSAYGAWTVKTLAEVEVNGPVYQRIVQGKDLIADVLPPPAYILESYLTALQLAQAKSPDEKNEQIAKFRQLKLDYDRRHEFWSKEPLDGELAEAFLKRSHYPAVAFFRVGIDEFIPAVLADDQQAAGAQLVRMRAAYQDHRQAIDSVVQMTKERNLAAENMARERIATSYQLLLVMLALCIVTGIGFAIVVIRSLMQSLGGEPAVLGEASRKIAGGDLDFEMVVSSSDQHSVLYQIDRMRHQLKARLALEKTQQDSDRRASIAEAELRIAEQKAQAEHEKQELYLSMTHAAQHVLNNLLNQLQLFKLAADRSSDFDRNILDLYDGMTREAKQLIARLSSVTELNQKNIRESVAPRS